MTKTIYFLGLLFFISSTLFAQDEVTTQKTSSVFEDASIELGGTLATISYAIPIEANNSRYYYKSPLCIGFKGMYQFEFAERNFLNIGLSATSFGLNKYISFNSNIGNSSSYYVLYNSVRIVESRLWLQYSTTFEKIAFTLSVSPLCITNYFVAYEYPKTYPYQVTRPTILKNIQNHTIGTLILSPGVKYSLQPNLVATAEIQLYNYIRFQHILQLGLNYSIKDIIQ
jgi:hypothetical protein